MSTQNDTPGTSGFFVQSIYGAFEKRPYVQVTVRHDGEVRNILMTPGEAADLALNLLTAAEAAQSDALIMHWLQDRMHTTEEQAGQVLMDFRMLREEMEQQEAIRKPSDDELRGYRHAFNNLRTALETMRGKLESKESMLKLLDVIESIDENLE